MVYLDSSVKTELFYVMYVPEKCVSAAACIEGLCIRVNMGVLCLSANV